MYQFSLSYYLQLFNQTLNADGYHGDDVKMRNSFLAGTLLKLVHQSVVRSLFKRDRELFALLLVHRMNRKQFGLNEWEFFLGSTSIDCDSDKNIEIPAWVPEHAKPKFTKLLVI